MTTTKKTDGFLDKGRQIVSYSFEQYVEQVKSFHGNTAPGMIIGGFMVDLAVKNLPDGILYDAISETQSCLPDAVQILTPCTIGNGWLTILPLGRYAVTLYDKQTKEGVRVFLDAEKLEPWPEIRKWFLKLVPKNNQDSERLFNETCSAGLNILGLRHIQIKPDFIGKMHKGKIALCPQCREAYPANTENLCLACQGETPYL